MDHPEVKQHSLLQSIIYHLLPGILIGVFYFLVRQPIENLGYPSVMGLIMAIIFILIPFELGFLLYQAKKTNGTYSLKGIISYTNPIPWWQLIFWVGLVFLLTGVIFTFLKPLELFFQSKLFFWIPQLNSGLDGEYSKQVLIFTYSIFFLFVAFLGPLVEELYFRGYLLPRMKGKIGPLLHSFLFAAYHVFTPWMIITRTIGLLPLIYAVKHKNIYVGIIVHILLNTIDVVAGIIFIFSMT
ncbi:MAG: CPBP family glutamic-type intramembrane protease [Anaerolineaceae bacterium]|nr:CPBP family glutamic-type intramembrane protease [Anaerolineaceae bacterium]